MWVRMDNRGQVIKYSISQMKTLNPRQELCLSQSHTTSWNQMSWCAGKWAHPALLGAIVVSAVQSVTYSAPAVYQRTRSCRPRGEENSAFTLKTHVEYGWGGQPHPTAHASLYVMDSEFSQEVSFRQWDHMVLLIKMTAIIGCFPGIVLNTWDCIKHFECI